MKLHLPHPCHEDWNRMTPQDQGRHCAACDRVIHDFSGMTDAELVAWLRANSGKICGRFRKDQLNRELPEPVRPPRRLPVWYGKVAGLLLALAVLQGCGTGPGDTPVHTDKSDISHTMGLPVIPDESDTSTYPNEQDTFRHLIPEENNKISPETH